MDNQITELLEKYATARRSGGYSESTIERVHLTVRMIARDMSINSLSELTTEEVLRWGDMRLQGELKPITRSGLYAAYNSVRSFAIFLEEEEEIEHNINRRKIKCKPAYDRRKALRPEDIRKIARRAEWYQIGVLIRLLFAAGMRIGEPLSWTPDDINPDGTADVTGKWAVPRTVIFGRELYKEMEWLAKDGGYIFKDRKDPTKPLNRKNAYYYIKKAMIEAGFGDYYPHAERHGYATDLLRNGADMSHVRRMMGHSSITTTQIYEHLVTDDLHKTYNRYHTKV